MPGRKKDLLSSAYRVHNCTHVQTSRKYGAHVCDQCHQIPKHGWVWRCTQDTDGKLAFAESGLDQEEKAIVQKTAEENAWELPGTKPSILQRECQAEDEVADIGILKPWVLKAMADGHYTSEQLTIMINQRLKVKHAIQIDEAAIRLEEESSLNSMKRLSQKPWLDGGSNFDMLNDFTRLHINEFPGELEERMEKRRLAGRCNYSICAKCKPVMRDRAWASIETAIMEPDSRVYPHDIDVRPLADTNLLRHLDYRVYAYNPPNSPSTMYTSSSEESPEQESVGRMIRRRSMTFLNNVRRVYRHYINESPRSRSAGDLTASDESSTSEEMEFLDHYEAGMTLMGMERPQSRLGNYSDLDQDPFTDHDESQNYESAHKSNNVQILDNTPEFITSGDDATESLITQA